jgi:hypothetical protein
MATIGSEIELQVNIPQIPELNKAPKRSFFQYQYVQFAKHVEETTNSLYIATGALDWGVTLDGKIERSGDVLLRTNMAVSFQQELAPELRDFPLYEIVKDCYWKLCTRDVYSYESEMQVVNEILYNATERTHYRSTMASTLGKTDSNGNPMALIPVLAWYDKVAATGFPLAGLARSELQFKLKLKRESELPCTAVAVTVPDSVGGTDTITLYPCIVSTNIYGQSKDGNTQGAAALNKIYATDAPNAKIADIVIYNDYATVQDSEREYFKTAPMLFLLEQLYREQYVEFDRKSGGNDVNIPMIKLNAQNPVKSIYFFTQHLHRRIELATISTATSGSTSTTAIGANTQSTQRWTSIWDNQIGATATAHDNHQCSTAQLNYSSFPRFRKEEGSFFTQEQRRNFRTYGRHNKPGFRDAIHIMTWSMYPADQTQPSGALPLPGITNPSITVKFPSVAASWTHYVAQNVSTGTEATELTASTALSIITQRVRLTTMIVQYNLMRFVPSPSGSYVVNLFAGA